MSRLSLELSEAAEDALAVIYRYSLDQWGKPRADRYLDDLEDLFQQLTENAAIGDRHPDIPLPHRVFPLKKHLVIYRVEKRKLYVVAIIHMSMHIAEQFDSILKHFQ